MIYFNNDNYIIFSLNDKRSEKYETDKGTLEIPYSSGKGEITYKGS